MRVFTVLRNRAVAVAVVSLLALAMGCGDGDGGDSTAGADSADTEAPDFGAPDGDGERAIAGSLEDLYADIADGGAEAVCDRLSEDGAKTTGGDSGDCEQGVDRLIASAERSGTLERVGDARVGDVEVDGDEAAATVSFGPQAARLTLRREEGDWRLDSSIAMPSAPADTAAKGDKKR